MTVCAVAAFLAAVNFVECPKCDKRMRIAENGRDASVNLSRIDPARKAEMAERAERLLALGKPPVAANPLTPLMGWSSWNTFGVDISEDIIVGIARTMATNGLKAAGYAYVNIDDGFFNGHGEDGRLRFHPQRFPNGMKGTVDGIHALGMKAGIYSDAGADTCGSIWGGSGSGGKDSGGVGGGLYGHDAADCRLHFNELGFDFIKVDYCGGGKLKLDERDRYMEIAKAIRATGRKDVRFNICRWAFPGTWAAEIAESWRTTRDIRANWKSVRDIIAENLYLSAYARPGHFNDLDMLEVGQLKGTVKSVFGKHGDTGLTPDEEAAHFGMWCILSSPLVLGNDVRIIPASTMRLVTNPYLVRMNQDPLGLQAYVAARDGDAYVLVKDADTRFGKSRYVALYNAGDSEHEFTVSARSLDLGGRIAAFDLMERADVGEFEGEVCVKVRPHAAKFYLVDAERRLDREVYEAETAYLTDYSELKNGSSDPAKGDGDFKRATYAEKAWASGGVAVVELGGRESNDLIWRDVHVSSDGKRRLAFRVSSPEPRTFAVQVDGGERITLKAPATGDGFVEVGLDVELAKGSHTIRLSNAAAKAPAIDLMRVLPANTVFVQDREVFVHDANYDKSKIPPYTLEDPLTFVDGRKVANSADWAARRREILGIFAKEMYGEEPPKPETLVTELVDEKPAIDGHAIRRQYRMWFKADRSGPCLNWIMWIPKPGKRPVPVISFLNYRGNHELVPDADIPVQQGWTRQGNNTDGNRSAARKRGAMQDPNSASIFPLGTILARGYAVMSACYCEISPDPTWTEKDPRFMQDPFAYTGVFELWGKRDRSRTDNITALGAWAWALSRGLDLAERIPELDAKRAVVTGCSRLGKAALIAAARDERFAVCVPNQTGGGGVPLAKRDYGENISTENRYFTHWYCRAYAKYAEAPWSTMPFDQHLFVACIAPRALLVQGFDSPWFDAEGEYLAVKAASPVWTFLGKGGMPDVPFPGDYDTSAIGKDLGYVRRAQNHGISAYDWHWMLNFADGVFGLFAAQFVK